jgi:hypothetical protein
LNVKRIGVVAFAALLCGIVVLTPPAKRVAAATTGWTTYHHDNSRNGYDASAPTYAGGPPSSQWTKAVDAMVYAEPLAFNGRVYVATMGDSVYAFDATTGTQVWARTAMGTPRAGYCSWGATTGIMSTPVIDPATNILYAVGLDDNAGSPRFQMYGLNLSDGSNAGGFPITLGPRPQDQNQRAALALANGHVYVAFGGWIGDCGTYHPYVASVPTTGVAQDHTYQPQTTCQNAAGIWGPSGIMVDGSGSLYVTTGNGTGCWGQPAITFPCNNSMWDHGDAVMKLSGTLVEQSFWAPHNATQSWCELHQGDIDIGSIGPALLPNGDIFQTGKSGYGWLLNSAALGGFDGQRFQGLVHSSCRVFGGVAFYNNKLYVPCDGAGLVAFSVDPVAHTFSSTPDWVQAVTPGAPIAAMGLIWVRNQSGSTLYGFDPATGATRVNINMGATTGIHFPSLAEDNGWIFVPHGANINAYNFNPPNPCASTSSPHWFANCSFKQYQLTGSNGGNWVDIDPTNLSISFTPTVPSYAILSANSSLWTSAAGYNQDLGIAVTGGAYPSVNGQPEAWKESGGPTTFAPNAAFVQTVIPVGAAATYTARLQWKTNQPDPFTTYAGAGPIGNAYSPTRITAMLVPVSSATVFSKSSTSQYSLGGSDGSTWSDMDAANLSLSFSPPAGNWLAYVSGNADLWTNGAGNNQDLGVSVTGGPYPSTAGQPEIWKESGGPATFSPNAAFAQAVLPVTGALGYTAKLQWKANHATSGTIWAGAGPGTKFSPTSLTVVLLPNPAGGASKSSTQQYSLYGSDGSTWQTIDPNVKLTLSPAGATNFLFAANVDLWTTALGYGQDIGLMISGGSYGSGTLVAWQESGAAGTFSPNAAYAFGDITLAGANTYNVWLVWKANHPAPGVSIVAGAGPIAGKFSPTWLTATALN